jgi:NitT/TauT family transport system permease protein
MTASPLARRAAPFVLLALLLALWEAICRGLQVAPFFLPAPSAIGTALAQSWPILLSSAGVTFGMALEALLVASLIATAVALLVSLNGLLDAAVRPLAVALQVTPVIAIAPQVSIWAGLDHADRAVIALAAVVAFFPIFSGTLTGLKSADPDLERLFDLYGARPLQRLFRLRLPSAMPFLLEGHMVAAGLAVVAAVVAEFVAGSGQTQGLAWRIMEAGNRLRTAEEFAALAVLAVLGLLFHAAMRALQSLVLSHGFGGGR